jgi:hypothetical protein
VEHYIRIAAGSDFEPCVRRHRYLSRCLLHLRVEHLLFGNREAKMRSFRVLAVSFTCLMLSVVSAGQNESKPVISNEPLTAEELTVYSVVLKNYRKDDASPMNLANRTDLFRSEEDSSDQACINGIQGMPPSVVHRISNATTLGPGLVLVDPDQQQEQIEKNDPQHLMKSAIDDHQNVTDRELDDTIKRAFETGLFTLSEIAFDKEHRRAVVAYSFACGGLCGSGGTLVLRRTGQTWKVTKHCGGWIS